MCGCCSRPACYQPGDRLSKIYLVSSWDGVWKCLIGFVVAFMGGEYRP